MSEQRLPNGIFKKQTYIFGLCFSWFITIYCLFFGTPNNTIHESLGTYSFVAGVSFVFALVFKFKIIKTPFFKIEEEHYDKGTKDE